VVRAALTGDPAQANQALEAASQAVAKAENIPIDQARTQVKGYQDQYQAMIKSAQQKAAQAADAAASSTAKGA
jgi:hypothetical protein